MVYLPVMVYKANLKDDAVLVDCTVVNEEKHFESRVSLTDFGFTYQTVESLCRWSDGSKLYSLKTRAIQQYLDLIRSYSDHVEPLEKSRLSYRELVLLLTMFRFVNIRHRSSTYSRVSFLESRKPNDQGGDRLWLRNELTTNGIDVWVMERTGIFQDQSRNYWEIIFS